MTLQEPVGNVLVVDDSADFQSIAANVAELSHCAATPATTLGEARRLTRCEQFDLILIDTQLPDGSGIELLDDIDPSAHGEIAVVTETPHLADAPARAPVAYLRKPLASDVLAGLLERAHRRARTRAPRRARFGAMVGQAPPMQALFERIRRVAPLDITVLVHGESGTGKELVARAVHDCSARAGRFVAVNCGAIAPDLLGSQLFGHERGSFTGALQAHAGYFEQAAGGTLFLDEITEMPLALQVYLLRVLENRALMRVGGSREIRIDVRVVAATNRDPRDAVASGVLRADLYYRLLEFPLAVPALGARRDDVPLLALHFLDELNRRHGTRRSLSPDALHQLKSRTWPGNVRELRYAVQRLYIMADGETIGPSAEPLFGATPDGSGSVHFRIGMTFDDVEREMLLKTLAYHGNNKRQAARVLGITAKTIYNRLLRYRELGLIGDAELGEPEADAGD